MSKGMNKDLAVAELKSGWNTLTVKARKDLIYSLLGHRLSLLTIAQLTGQSIEDVKSAYKGEDTSAKVFIPTAAPLPEGLDPEAVSPKITEVSPVKAIYGLHSFDEILAKYREWIGWYEHTNESGVGPNEDDYLYGLIISDIHAPFHDEQRFAKMIAQTRAKVDVCILGGDGPDFHNYSKYMKYGQHFTPQQEHKAFLAVLAMLSEAYPEVIMIPGNHDERTRKKYAGMLPPDMYQAVLDFHGPNAFDFAELMARQFENVIIPDMPKNGFAEYRFVYQIFDIIIGHPEVFSKIANKSVAAFIDWLMKKAIPMGLVHGPISAVVMGHTHQAGKTWNDYGIVGLENGCLCETPDYDAQPKLTGAPRPVVHGYTLFKTNKLTGNTSHNDIQFVELE
jgi:predicted phosphodiesterase